jgi:hypothetical protein
MVNEGRNCTGILKKHDCYIRRTRIVLLDNRSKWGSWKGEGKACVVPGMYKGLMVDAAKERGSMV